MTRQAPTNDLFAQIATQRLAQRNGDLVQPGPVEIPKRTLPLDRRVRRQKHKSPRRVTTAAQLDAELKRYRRRYAKFLKDIAPPIESHRTVLSMAQFQWREETKLDRRNFAGHTIAGKGKWQRVRIPHYGPPLGPVVTYYRRTFRLSKRMLERGSLWACFDGVDYKGHVFVNGSYIGSHEGFFAPFEFEFSQHAKLGENTLLVKVENDTSMLGSLTPGDPTDGDKIYAASGLGYDDPDLGWHHCPSGMGIWQPVRIEARKRQFISDLFVRPLPEENRAEVWIEVSSGDIQTTPIHFELSLFGQNFRKTVFKNRPFQPQTSQIRGHGDVDQYTNPCVDQPAGRGVNYYRIPIDVPNAQRWELEQPWLYQLQAKLIKGDQVLDTAKQQFGMRSFTQDEDSTPRGKFYLNGRETRLRGANTMGHLQQCVFRGDNDQLVDDILLAKICNMNFLRLTQRPVQKQIYEACDRLGLMTQTDLPLFGKLRRNQLLESVKQSLEMERLIRPHASAILVSYINEPYPNATGKPHRHLTRDELDDFFQMATRVIRHANPDRVIKCCDGDYDPPAPFGMPDNHCYCGWYIGHGLDLGKLHRGYWIPVEKDWHYGCGEFGSEGLDFRNTMEEFYPRDWLPGPGQNGETWKPGAISLAQTERFHYLWYETPRGIDGWIEESQEFQAWITKLMTESFRRDGCMNTFAIHLFVDAWPAGWMKTIMDVKRQPKKAYFAYRDALSPLFVSFRSDRWGYRGGETIDLEAWVCNDLDSAPSGATLVYQLESEGRVIESGRTRAKVPRCDASPQGTVSFTAPKVDQRTAATAKIALLDRSGQVVHENELPLVVYPSCTASTQDRVYVVGDRKGSAATLARQLGRRTAFTGSIRTGDVIVCDDVALWRKRATEIDRAVHDGATAVLLELPPGTHNVAGDSINIANGGMGKRHFVSRDTGHPLVDGFEPNDFRFWYDASAGYITPIIDTVIDSQLNKEWLTVLQSGNGDWRTDWHAAPATIEKQVGKGAYRICQVKLVNRTAANPVAEDFAIRLIGRPSPCDA